MRQSLACDSLKTDIVYSLGRQEHCRAQSRAGNGAVGTRLVILRAGTGKRKSLGLDTVCRRGTQKPCYKLVYFHDASRRSSYEEAHLACRADGGHLVSIESPAEQRLIESFIRSLLASDGDFWIGLRRRKEEEENSTECHSFYSWSDGSSSKFRNWYVDEPSCGGEVCVVLYHQPSAPPGLGGPYMFQWNDDRCTMKNNFICKYSLGEEPLCGIQSSITQREGRKLEVLKYSNRYKARWRFCPSSSPSSSWVWVIPSSSRVWVILCNWRENSALLVTVIGYWVKSQNNLGVIS
uniref:Layilin n=1 Tax=Ficedula albicollis TaxID=59894 RepID=A0A803W8X1_FICAL